MTTIHSSLKKKTWRDLSLAFQWSLHSGYGGFLTAPTSHHYTPSVSTGDELKRKKQWQQCLLQLEVTLKIWWDMKHLLKNVLQTDVWVYMETISNHEISSIFSFQNSSLKRPHPHTHTRPPPTHTKKKNQQPGCLPILSQSTKKANSDVTRHLVGLQHAIEPRQQFLRAVVRVHQDLEASGAPGVVAWKFIRFNTSKWVLKVN